MGRHLLDVWQRAARHPSWRLGVDFLEHHPSVQHLAGVDNVFWYEGWIPRCCRRATAGCDNEQKASQDGEEGRSKGAIPVMQQTLGLKDEIVKKNGPRRPPLLSLRASAPTLQDSSAEYARGALLWLRIGSDHAEANWWKSESKQTKRGIDTSSDPSIYPMLKVPAAMLHIHIHSDTIYRTIARLCLHLGRDLDLSLLPVLVG